jgi:hypothetical protein
LLQKKGLPALHYFSIIVGFILTIVYQRPSQLLPEDIDTESALMQALADLEEDERLDDGTIEIDSDQEFRT